MTTLHEAAPLVLLNVSLGDTARLGARACGCALERAGWTTHLSGVRSFEKLTSVGMTFLEVDVGRVLEDVLPARFGGTPGDYQLVEEEAADGMPQLCLRIHPAVGPVDPREVVAAFLAALGSDRGAQQVMAMIWRDSRVVRVERRPPVTTRTGKVSLVHRVAGSVESERRTEPRSPE